MAFEHLQLFRDIVQNRSLSRGAAMNGISQSAASQHLHDLESRLGLSLLDRSTRPFTLTEAGKLYYELCRDVLRRKEKFDADLGDLRSEVEGTVRVACIYSVGLSDMSRLRDVFATRFPRATVHVDYLRPEKVYEHVLTDQADLGLVSYPEPSHGLAVIPWREEEMVLAAAPTHPLALRKSVKPSDLDGLEFVTFDNDLPIRREIDRFLREQDVEVNVTMHFDNIRMVMEAVALGYAVSILPARMMHADMAQGRLVGVPLESKLVRPVGIVHRKRKRFNRAAQIFLKLLQELPQEIPTGVATAETAQPAPKRLGLVRA